MIAKYLPVDYIDSYSVDLCGKQPITAGEFFDSALNHLPLWVNWLMKLRNILVKPLGLDTGGSFSDTVIDRNEGEVIFGMPDKHLTFHASIWCGQHQNDRQEIGITTVVKYNNTIGRIYFFVIRPFHGMIIRSILRVCLIQSEPANQLQY